jgi:flavin-dependent thymidylate synthase
MNHTHSPGDWKAVGLLNSSQIGLHLMLAHGLTETEVYGVAIKGGLIGFHKRLHSEPLPTTAETEITVSEEKTKEVSRWADSAMYRSEPQSGQGGPRVTLLNATPDPLGSLAALMAMYAGRVVRNISDSTDDERRQALTDVLATELQGPLESIVFHFLIEGVTRSWTHQAVRERQAFFAQESMRFAVVEGEDWTERVALPPSLAGPKSGESLFNRQRDAWEDAVGVAQESYKMLVDSGVPAEDARGIMPHAMTTRLHVVLNLRSLLHLAGLRLCTQAQFEWRAVVAGMVLALRSYAIYPSNPGSVYDKQWADSAWQFQLIADALKPICYQKGQCGFMAQFDRGCTIRERVDILGKAGIPSSQWGDDPAPLWRQQVGQEKQGIRINPSEWAADPMAARRGD